MSTAIAKPDQRVATFRSLLNAQRDEIAKALPRHMNPEHMVRVALTAMQKTPKLLDCDPMSVLACVMGASELGLELSGPLGQAYMVPRYNKHLGCDAATLQIGYRGFHQLAFRSGEVRSFPARVVRESEPFEVRYGTNQWIDHRPQMDGVPGKIIAFYAVLYFTRGEPDFEVMSLAEMEAHRKRYAPKNEVWDTNFPEMGMKTVVRRLAKRAPVSTDLVRAAVIDEYGEADVDQGLPDAGPPTAEMTKLRLEMMKERLQAGDVSCAPPVREEAALPAVSDGPLHAIQARFTALGWTDEEVSEFYDAHFPNVHGPLSQAQAEDAGKKLDTLLATRPSAEKSGRAGKAQK